MKYNSVYTIFLSLILLSPMIDACTGFGAITNTGTIIGKSREYFYNPQKFQLFKPLPSLKDWHGNHYGHSNSFYALTGAADTHYEFNLKSDLSMGVNQQGFSAIEEDSTRPHEDHKQRRFYQPEGGTDVNTVLYGALQNFNTVDEMLPYLSKIFSIAAPDFYQFSDNKKILIIEVAFAKNDADPQRQFSYKIFDKKSDYFAHTNSYLTPEFSHLNNEGNSIEANRFASSNSRLEKLNHYLKQTKTIDINNTAQWFLDTRSSISVAPRSCQDTSLFRSDLQDEKSINTQLGSAKVYGTVSTMIISHGADLKKSYLYLKMIDSITLDGRNNQLIKYKELRTNLDTLFKQQKPLFIERQFIRNAPIHGVCR